MKLPLRPLLFRVLPMERPRLVVAAAAGLLALTGTARAQSYSMDWFTVDGGGSTSTAGSYSMTGTIGQPDAGTLNGGSFALQGGFWPGLAVPISGGPILLIQLTGSQVSISWSPPTPVRVGDGGQPGGTRVDSGSWRKQHSDGDGYQSADPILPIDQP